MELGAFLESPWFAYVVLPLAIFCARITDVSVGTMRVIVLSKGRKYVAPVLGFIEVTLWLLAMSQIMKHLDNWVCYVAYGGGFATGTFVGIVIEEKMAIGTVAVRVITQRGATALRDSLRDAGFGVTVVNAEGREGAVHVLYVVIRRRLLSKVTGLIREHNPNSFYSVEEIRAVSGGIHPQGGSEIKPVALPLRKGK